MKTKIVRIGNSRGIRIPKSLLHQCHLDGPVEVDVQGDQLVVRSLARPRSGWDDAFRDMHQTGERSPPSRWDREEWRWLFATSRSISFASISLKAAKSETPAPNC